MAKDEVPEISYDEYVMPRGEVIKDVQQGGHLLRTKAASLVELRSQIVEEIKAMQFAVERIDEQLRNVSKAID